MNEKTIKNEKKLAKIFSPKKPIMTYLLIILNILVYNYIAFYDSDGSIFNSLANNYIYVQKGQIYRLFTCMFVHSGLLHLLFNMYALYIIGPQVERYYGKSKFLLIYFLSGLLGSIFSSVFMNSNVLSIGASGAIFGLLGSILYFTYYYRATLQGIMKSQIMPVIVINLALGFFISDIDIFAHIGGLIGGILASMAIGIGDKGRKSDQINGIIVLIVMIAALFYMITIK